MKKSSGQALLIVLLVLSVALTAGLSLVARTTTDISISQKETESNKAFEAAEAGVEEALKKIEEGAISPGFVIDEEGLGDIGASSRVSLADIPNNQAARILYPGEAATFWLNNFTLDGEAFPSSEVAWAGDSRICWDDSSVNDKVEVIVYYYDGTYGFNRYYGVGSGVSCSADGSGDFGQGIEIPNLDNKHKFVNVRFYGSGSEAVRFVAESSSGSPSLPSQGKIIESQGEVGDVSRRIQVTKTWPELPSFFDFILFSGGDLTK